MATTASPSVWKGPSHSHSNSRSSRPITTPRAHTTPSHMKSVLSPSARSPPTSNSPSYFGVGVGDVSVPNDSGPGPHTRQNWQEASKPVSRPSENEPNSGLDMFRRQSDKNVAFSLNSLPGQIKSSTDTSSRNQSDRSPVSPTNQSSQALGRDSEDGKDKDQPRSDRVGNPFFLGVQRQESPLTLSPRTSITDTRNSRLSLPAHELQASLETLRSQRSDTLPIQPSKDYNAMMAPQEVANVVQHHSDSTLILDLRVYPQYTASRVKGALNLCIPTTLLKRPAFTVQKLADTFTSEPDKQKFSQWKKSQYIVVYDATSSSAKEAITSFHVLKKFMTEGWKGNGLVIKGGFAGLQRLAPQLIDTANKTPGQSSKAGTSSQPLSGLPKLPVAGGCQLPSTETAANPFFGNIRQNMDLLDGVGQLPIKKPTGMKEGVERRLPTWLKRAASVSNEGKDVSNKFLYIEQGEQKRMQKALSTQVSYGTPAADNSNKVQVAGIEKGSKNRYNNIFPFEHSRVRLQNAASHECDYVNASYVKTTYSNRKYIATQAPTPQTFDDFWRVIWEQDVRVVVMLTAETEGGQVKSHPYWKTGDYGKLKVKQTVEKVVPLGAETSVQKEGVQRKEISGRRMTASSATPAAEKTFNFAPAQSKQTSKSDDDSTVIVRQFTVTNQSHPSKTVREITQVQYTQWPDFGAPASPSAILNLIDLVDKFQRGSSSPTTANAPNEPANPGQRPIIVHCSAGCGRTGTFCTIDSVIDMLKKQRRERNSSRDAMDVDSTDDWVERDDIDLVTKAVEDFRHQRLSMVQNLRQFVLCYESILEWFCHHG